MKATDHAQTGTDSAAEPSSPSSGKVPGRRTRTGALATHKRGAPPSPAKDGLAGSPQADSCVDELDANAPFALHLEEPADQCEDDALVHVTLPTANPISDVEGHLIRTALAAANPGIGALVTAGTAMANALGVTVAMGLAAKTGRILAIGGSFGVAVAPGDVIGVYGTWPAWPPRFVAGRGILSPSVELNVTIVKGGMSSLGGQSVGATAPIGPIGVTALFTTGAQFLGVSGSLGIGAAREAYLSYQNTWRRETVVPRLQP